MVPRVMVGTRIDNPMKDEVLAPAPETHIRVAVLSGAAALQMEEAEWRRLAVDAHLLIQYEWVTAWLKAFGERVEFSLLKATRGEEVVGYLPLVRTRTRWRRLPVTLLSLCANEHSTWGSVLLKSGRDGEVAQAFGDFLLQWRTWDIMQLPRLPLLSTCSRHLLDVLLASGAGSVSRLEYQFVMRLPERWEDYIASLSRNFRDNLSSTRRRLGKLGTCGVVVTRTPEETLLAFDALVDVDQRSWKQRNGETIASRPHANAFYQALVEAFAPLDRCWITRYELDGRVISAALFFEQNGVAYGLKSSSDVEVEAGSISAGHVTLLSGVEEAHRRGLRSVQVLSGSPAWQRYRGELEPVLSGHAYNRHLYGRLVEFADRIASGLIKTAPIYAMPANRRLREDRQADSGKNQV